MKSWELRTSIQTDDNVAYPKGTRMNLISDIISQSSQSNESSWLARLGVAHRVHCRSVIDDSLSAPPGSPGYGDSYIVGSSPTGLWSGFSQGDLVQWNGVSWALILAGSGTEPADGCQVIVKWGSAAGSFVGEENNMATYDAIGNVWNFTDKDEVVVFGIIQSNASGYRGIHCFSYQSGPPAWTSLYTISSADEIGMYLYVVGWGSTGKEILWGASSEILEVGEIQ